MMHILQEMQIAWKLGTDRTINVSWDDLFLLVQESICTAVDICCISLSNQVLKYAHNMLDASEEPHSFSWKVTNNI